MDIWAVKAGAEFYRPLDDALNIFQSMAMEWAINARMSHEGRVA